MSVGYFLDEMQEYEANALIKSLDFADVAAWEQTRFNVYSFAQMFSKKQLKPSDILKFAWDRETTDEHAHEISNDDIERLKKLSRNIKL